VILRPAKSAISGGLATVFAAIEREANLGLETNYISSVKFFTSLVLTDDLSPKFADTSPQRNGEKTWRYVGMIVPLPMPFSAMTCPLTTNDD
jgi:hypothetical protein